MRPSIDSSGIGIDENSENQIQNYTHFLKVNQYFHLYCDFTHLHPVLRKGCFWLCSSLNSAPPSSRRFAAKADVDDADAGVGGRSFDEVWGDLFFQLRKLRASFEQSSVLSSRSFVVQLKQRVSPTFWQQRKNPNSFLLIANHDHQEFSRKIKIKQLVTF